MRLKKIDEDIKIKMRNRHMGILGPTEKDFEADDLSIEALKRRKYESERTSRWADMPLPGETKE